MLRSIVFLSFSDLFSMALLLSFLKDQLSLVSAIALLILRSWFVYFFSAVSVESLTRRLTVALFPGSKDFSSQRMKRYSS